MKINSNSKFLISLFTLAFFILVSMFLYNFTDLENKYHAVFRISLILLLSICFYFFVNSIADNKKISIFLSIASLLLLTYFVPKGVINSDVKLVPTSGLSFYPLEHEGEKEGCNANNVDERGLIVVLTLGYRSSERNDKDYIVRASGEKIKVVVDGRDYSYKKWFYMDFWGGGIIDGSEKKYNEGMYKINLKNDYSVDAFFAPVNSNFSFGSIKKFEALEVIVDANISGQPTNGYRCKVDKAELNSLLKERKDHCSTFTVNCT